MSSAFSQHTCITTRKQNKKVRLTPQSPQATVCCYVGASAAVHFRPGRPGLPANLQQCAQYSSVNSVHKMLPSYAVIRTINNIILNVIHASYHIIIDTTTEAHLGHARKKPHLVPSRYFSHSLKTLSFSLKILSHNR